MNGIEIHDKDRSRILEFDLSHILDTLGPIVSQWRWKLRWVECTGPAAERLHAFSDNEEVISGSDLVKISRRLVQVTDGYFEARDKPGTRAALVRAIDSTLWEVFAEQTLLNQIESSFQDTRPAKYPIDW